RAPPIPSLRPYTPLSRSINDAQKINAHGKARALQSRRPPEAGSGRKTLRTPEILRYPRGSRSHQSAVLTGRHVDQRFFAVVGPGDRKSTRLNSSHVSSSY